MARVPEVLLVSGREQLHEAVSRLAAAVGLGLRVVPEVEAAGTAWWSAPLVLLGEDAAGRGVPRRRAGLVVLTGDPPPERAWRWAVDVGAEHVAALPAAEHWLVERLAEVAGGARRAAPVVGVVGGRGGGGASTLAAALASVATARGSVLLVDADPCGPGLDLLLGAENVPGLRWSDLAGVSGPVRPEVLRNALPSVSGISLLARGAARDRAAEPGPTAADAVLRSARHSHDLVVVDLPRSPGAGREAVLARVETVLLVVPAEVRAAVAATHVLPGLLAQVADVRLVVRGPSPADLSPTAVADVLELPLVCAMRGQPGLAAQLERGGPPVRPSSRGPLAGACRRLLDDLLAPGDAVGAA